jgi:hypothetical protein
VSRLSIPGLILAAVYIFVALYLIRDDRNSTGGGWINLNGMTSYLVTLPVSAFCEVVLGNKLNFRSNFDMSLAVSLCSLLMYLIGAGAGFLFRVVDRMPGIR